MKINWTLYILFLVLTNSSSPVTAEENLLTDKNDEYQCRWLEERIKEAISIRAGMSRADLLKVFDVVPGVQDHLPSRYILRSCPSIGVIVTFRIPNQIVPVDLHNETLKIRRVSFLYPCHSLLVEEEAERKNRTFELKLAKNAIKCANRDTSVGGYKNAIKTLDPVIESGLDLAETYSARGLAFYALGDYQKAINDCNQAIKLDTHLADAYNNRAHVNLDLGCYEKALSDATKAITLRTNWNCAYDTRALSYLALKDPKKAIEDSSKSINLESQVAAIAYYIRGRAHLQLAKYEEAIKEFNKASVLPPAVDNQGKFAINFSGAEIYYHRAECYRKLGNNKQAEADEHTAKALGYYTYKHRLIRAESPR